MVALVHSIHGLCVLFSLVLSVLFSASIGSAVAQPVSPTPGQEAGWLGIEIRTLTPDDAAALSLPSSDGVIVNNVTGDPAIKSGLRAGDIVLRADDKAMATAEALTEFIRSRGPGARLKLDINRFGSTETLVAVVGQRPVPPILVGQAAIQRFVYLVQTWHGMGNAPREQQIAILEEALELEPRLDQWPMKDPRHRVMGVLLSALGDAYQARRVGDQAENVERAIAALERALTFRKREENAVGWALTHDHLGNAYSRRGGRAAALNLEKAIASYEAALSAWATTNRNVDRAQTMVNLGSTLAGSDYGDPAENREKAIAYLTEALTVFERTSHSNDWATAKLNLGVAYLQRRAGQKDDNTEAAIAAFKDAETVYTKSRAPFDWAGLQVNLAVAYGRRTRGGKATNKVRELAFLEAALTVFTPANDPYSFAKVQLNRSSVYLSGEGPGTKTEQVKKANAILREALGAVSTDDTPGLFMEVANQLGEGLAMARQWSDARDALLLATKAYDRLFDEGFDAPAAASLIKKAGDLFVEAAVASARAGQLKNALVLAVQGRARQISVQLKINRAQADVGRNKSIADLRNNIAAVEDSLQGLVGTGRPQLIGQLAVLRADLRQAVSELTASREKRDPSEEIVRAVQDDSVIVAPLITSETSLILIGVREGATFRVVKIEVPGLTAKALKTLLTGDAVGKAAGGWLGAFNIQSLPPNERNERIGEWLAAIGDIGPKLWSLFAGSVDKELASLGVGNNQRLIWMPSNALGMLPLELARDPQTGRLFGDAYQVATAPLLDSVPRTTSKDQPKTTSLAAIINPTGADPALALPFTEIEGALVGSQFAASNRQVLLKSEATATNVLQVLTKASHWHFATHGTFSWTSVSQSALLLHGGERLTVGRLLKEQNLSMPRLVVLSACETGLYETSRSPEEFVGLPGAFLALGAQGVVGTLWQVDDLATSLLISRFYSLHIGKGLEPSVALPQAKQWLRTATRQTLLDAIGELAKGPDFSPMQATLLTQGLSARSARYIEDIATERSGPKRSAESEAVRQSHFEGDLSDTPFSHPYFWGGFIFLGR